MNRPDIADLRFQPLLECGAEELERVRELRNSEAVRRHMYNDHLISAEEHARWVDGLRGNAGESVMVTRYRDELVGVVALRGIRWQHRTADWAFYLSEAMQSRGIGGLVEFKLLDLAFDELRLEKLNCEVLASNAAVIDLHRKFGFQLEGIRRSMVLRAGRREDVHLLGITPDEWQRSRPRFARLYASR